MRTIIQILALAIALLVPFTATSQYTPWAVQWLQHAFNAENGRLYMGVNYTNGFDCYRGIVFKNSQTNRLIDMTASTNTYNDLVFPAATLNPPGPVGGGTTVATSGTSGDQIALELDDNQVFWVTIQMSHTYTAGTRVYPHIHIEPQSANLNNVVGEVKYSIADINGLFPADTTDPANFSIPAGNQWRHLLFNIPPGGIDMTGKTNLSTIIRMRFRAVTVDEPIHVVSFDVHYLVGGSPIPYNP